MYLENDEITSETPVSFLTVGQLMSVLNKSERKDNPPVNIQFPKTFGVDTFCKMTGYKRPTVYCKTSKNEVPHFKMGSKILFDRDTIIEWMTKNRIETKEEATRNLDSKLVKRKGGLK